MSLPILHLVPLGLGLAWAIVSDLRRRRVPNAATGLVFLGGLLVRGLEGGPLASLAGVGAAALVIAALFRPWSLGGLGGGDVKLAAATGAWMGLGAKLVWFALATAAGGGVVAVICYFANRAPARREIRDNLTLAVLHGDLPSIPTRREGHISIPYAVAITVGAVVALFLI